MRARLPFAGRAALGSAIAISVFVATRSSGSYFATAWPLLGGVTVLGAAVLLLTGRRPAVWITAAACSLAAYGSWSLVSVAWGGLPDDAWTTFDQSLIGAAALLLGSLLAGMGCSRWAMGGVATGLTLEAIELLYRLQDGPAPGDWFDGRKIQGPVGYANAQAAFLAVGVPLALWFAADRRIAVRLAAGAGVGVLIGALLLTQSRGAVLALALALLVQVAHSRDVRTLSLVLVGTLYVGALWRPLRRVDRAVVDGGDRLQVDAFRHLTAFVVVGAVVFALLAAVPPAVTVARRVLLAGAALAVVVAVVAVVVARPGVVHDVRRVVSGSLSGGEPANLPGGDTRFTSLSLTGRGKLWVVALHLYGDHPALGAGKGTFARRFDLDRKDYNLAVLQPHSIELEALSELGIPGVVFFVAFALCAVLALARPLKARRGATAAALGALTVLIAQASVDWTFSFPGLVVAVLVLVGAAAGVGRRGSTSLPAYAIGAVLTAALLVGLAGPYLAARALARAEKALPRDPASAWETASRARGYDRWNPNVVALQARIAETSGKRLLAADLFGRAAELAPHLWRYKADQARVLSEAGLKRKSRDACRTALAANPLEPTLLYDVCPGIDH